MPKAEIIPVAVIVDEIGDVDVPAVDVPKTKAPSATIVTEVISVPLNVN